MNIKKNVFILKAISILLLTFFLSSCQQEEESEANCEAGEVYNVKTRDCDVGALALVDKTPNGTTETVFINEDSTDNLIELTYTDGDNDLASACTIISVDSSSLMGELDASPPSCDCNGGLCVAKITPKANIPLGHTNRQSEFVYSISDFDGTGEISTAPVVIVTIDDLPIATGAVGPVVKEEDVEMLWALNYTDDDDNGSLLFEFASFCSIKNISSNFNITTACSCTLGICTVGITADLNYNNDNLGGVDSFGFTVTVNGVESNEITVDLPIEKRNDFPIISSLSAQFSSEDVAFVETPELQLDEGGGVDEDSESLTLISAGFTRSGNLTADITEANIRVLLFNTGTGLYDDIGDLSDLISGVSLGAGAGPKIKLRYIPHLIHNSVIYRSSISNGDGAQIELVAGGATSSAAVGKVVTVTLGAGATADDIVAAIAGDVSSAAIITAEAIDGSAVQVGLAPTNLISNENGLLVLKLSLVDNGNDLIGNNNLVTTTQDNTVGNNAPFDYEFTLLPVDDGPENTATTVVPNPMEDIEFTSVLNYTDVDSGLAADSCQLSNLLNLSGTCACTAGICTATLLGDQNYSGAGSFDYTVSVAGLVSTATSVSLTIDAVNDPPVVCEHSHYMEAKECGLLGCVGSSSPKGVLVPLSHTAEKPLYYYEVGNAVCYKSTGSSSDQDWAALTTGYIGNHIINEKDTVIIENIKVDEGGGDANEDVEEIEITGVTSSNNTLIPTNNIKFFFDGAALALNTLTAEAAVSVDTKSFRIELTPVGGQVGNSDISLTFKDNNAASSTITFNVQVDGVSTQHEGWKNISSVGPRVTREDQTIGSVTNNCSFNLTKCNSSVCTGLSDPSGSITPTENSTIYYNSQDKKCFISTGVGDNSLWQDFDTPCNVSDTELVPQCTQGKLTHQGLIFRSLVENGTGISLILQDVAAAESGNPAAGILISVNGQQITGVLGHDGAGGTTSTATDLKTALDGSGASALVRVEAVDGSIVQSALAETFLEGQAACVDAGSPVPGVNTNTELDPTTFTLNDFYYDFAAEKCYRITTSDLSDLSTTANYIWEEYDATSVVTLEWNNFSVFGSGSIVGWNVYRKVGDDLFSFDYKRPLNREIIPASILKYEDKTVNSFFAPVPKTVYHYEVRPVIRNASSGLELATDTNEKFKTIRVVSPPDNMTFVHRWMVNQGICQLMHASDIDPQNNFRCTYQGPAHLCRYSLQACSGVDCVGAGTPDGVQTAAIGALYFDNTGDKCYENTDSATAWSEISTNEYYDIGGDLLVDTYEAGCPFSTSPSCDTPDGTCVGIDDPQGSVTDLAVNSIYYQRSTGSCFLSLGGTNWRLVAASDMSLMTAYKKAEYPPLVNISQSEAQLFCEDNGLVLGGTNDQITGIIGYSKAVDGTLPTREQQMAYGQWHPDIADDVVADTERGINLNSTSKCNSTGASGFEGNYTNADIPSSSNIFTLPGTENSVIRSMATGSVQTASCVTRFGLQDVVGNVSEWVQEQMNCRDLSTCTALPAANFTFSNSKNPRVWGFDGDIGPCSDVSVSGVCDAFLDRWFIDDEKFNAERMFIPMGLPGHGDYVNLNPTATINSDLLEIGPSSGITSLQLHADEFVFNTHEIFSSDAGLGNFATGGSYESGQGAGAYYLKLLPNSTTAYGYVLTSDIAIKSITPLTANNNYSFSLSSKTQCSYTSDCAGGTSADCIGFDHPEDEDITGVAGVSVFYNFETDLCYSTADGVTWDEILRAENSNAAGEIVNLNTNARTILVILDNSGGVISSTADEVITALASHGSIAPVTSTNGADLFRVVLIGDGTSLQSSLSSPVKFTLTENKSTMVDVGFRCIAPLDDTHYNKQL